jgi:hypothetical protein
MNLMIKPVKARASKSKKAIKSTIKFTVVRFIMLNLKLAPFCGFPFSNIFGKWGPCKKMAKCESNNTQNAHVSEPQISKIKYDDYTAVFITDKAEIEQKMIAFRRDFDTQAKIKTESTW